MSATIVAGRAHPLGATMTTREGRPGVNFAVHSGHARSVALALFDGDDRETLLPLPGRSGAVWHGFVPGIVPGQRYGFRADGPYAPELGHRFNPHKLLLDPYAKHISGEAAGDARLYDFVAHGNGWMADSRDSAPVMPRCVVVDDAFDWGDDRPPGTPLADSIIYELHVKGFTRLHPQVPREHRGTYLGLAHPAVTGYLAGLGITAVELMPCAHFIDERHLAEQGLRNYWGYNTIGFFAPHAGFAVEDPVSEFKTMVRALHAAGIEVYVDMVFNHTAEGGQHGPTFSFRGLDNAGYYLLRPNDPAAYVNNSGTGNSLATEHRHVLRLTLDAMRYWVKELRVDGFRFDLAPSLGRVRGEFDAGAPFFQAVYQDPVLSQVKLIAEPWDVGHNGYRLGAFPQGWSEWNDRYRDTVRSFWRGDAGRVGEFAERLAGSSDHFRHGHRAPDASINLITAHDGFTLLDLVSYERKHNEANREDNRDGHSHNLSWNCGVEGPTRNPRIRALRARQQRNLLATLLLSQGVPMLLAGDEIGRTQRGNNNAYNQDNEISWVDWREPWFDAGLLAFTRKLIALRRDHPVFRRRSFLDGLVDPRAQLHDVVWLAPEGGRMQADHWQDPRRRCFGMLLPAALDSADHEGGDGFLLLFNAAGQSRSFAIPPPVHRPRWELLLHTAGDGREAAASDVVDLGAHAMAVLIDRRADRAGALC